MKLVDRDINIINFITENHGATIEQIQKLFFPSYDMSSKRLKLLADNKYLKVAIHPVLGKKVYYLKKIPSFHSLVVSSVTILLKDKIKFMQREYKVKNNFVDCIFILNTGKIIVLEVDIFNRTKDKKIDEVLSTLSETKAEIEFWIVSKHKRKNNNKKKIVLIGIEEIDKISQIEMLR